MAVKAILAEQRPIINEATTTEAGLMSADDKRKLNNIEAGAEVNTITGVKGNAESDYRTGNINITAENIGAASKPEAFDIALEVENWKALFQWGDEEGDADATWFADLANYIAQEGADISWVGKTKSVTLSEPVLGTTTHLIRCIGVNQDGENTVTFQTSNALANTTTFGSNSVWIGSTARAECINYYNAFPGKAYIKTVSKGTCPSTDDSRNGTPTYNDETVWLPSEREMGLDDCAPISPANSTTSKAECTQGYNATYSYYNSYDRRKKAQGDSGAAVYYWGRSRYYLSNYSNYVCFVFKTGSVGHAVYNSSYGLAPAFVIGPTSDPESLPIGQTVIDSRFLASGNSYTISPAPSSLLAYVSSSIYADDVTSNGAITFHCTEIPEDDLAVHVLKQEVLE